MYIQCETGLAINFISITHLYEVISSLTLGIITPIVYYFVGKYTSKSHLKGTCSYTHIQCGSHG